MYAWVVSLELDRKLAQRAFARLARGAERADVLGVDRHPADALGKALVGENQDVAFGSPLKAIEPGTALDKAIARSLALFPEARETDRASRGA